MKSPFSLFKNIDKPDIDLLKSNVTDMVSNIRKEVDASDYTGSCFGFISLNNGAGVKTTAVNVAIELSKKYRVCILDCNFIQPGAWVLLDTPIKEEKSLTKFLVSKQEIADCFIPVEGLKNIWLISTDPLDSPILLGSISKETIDEMMDYLKRAFDYIIMPMTYNPYAEWFVYILYHLDKGYFVWDDQVDCALKTKVVLDYVHRISSKASQINNVILNKLFKGAYDYELIAKVECDYITELPYVREIPLDKNTGKIYMKRSSINKKYKEGIEAIAEDIQSGIIL